MWGNNEHGQLGLGDITNRKQPTRVTKLKREFVLVLPALPSPFPSLSPSFSFYSYHYSKTLHRELRVAMRTQYATRLQGKCILGVSAPRQAR